MARHLGQIDFDMFKTLVGNNALTALVDLFNSIYDTAKITRYLLKSIFVPILKKTKTKYCKDYRTVSLCSHILKLFLKIIYIRIYRICQSNISST